MQYNCIFAVTKNSLSFDLFQSTVYFHEESLQMGYIEKKKNEKLKPHLYERICASKRMKHFSINYILKALHLRLISIY